MVKERLYIISAPFRREDGIIRSSIHSVRGEDEWSALNKWKNEYFSLCETICGRVLVCEANAGRVDGNKYIFNLIKEESDGVITYRGSKV